MICVLEIAIESGKIDSEKMPKLLLRLDLLVGSVYPTFIKKNMVDMYKPYYKGGINCR